MHRPFLLLILAAFASPLTAAPLPVLLLNLESPTLGGSVGRNAASPFAWGLPDDFDPATGKHILWTADLGSRVYGGVAAVGGRVFVGTNNQKPRDPRDLVAPRRARRRNPSTGAL